MDMMGIRRSLLAMQKSPPQYKEIEYISATGTQYIATDYVPQIGDQIKTKFLLSSNSAMQTVFSAGNSNYQLILLKYGNATNFNFYYKYFAAGDAKNLTWNLSYGVWHDVEINANGYMTSGQKTGTSTPAGELDGNLKNLWLFKRRNGTCSLTGSIGKFTITRNGVKTLDLVPCVRKSDNAIGMYDAVSNQFYGNAGSGVFIAGPDV